MSFQEIREKLVGATIVNASGDVRYFGEPEERLTAFNMRVVTQSGETLLFELCGDDPEDEMIVNLRRVPKPSPHDPPSLLADAERYAAEGDIT